MKRILFFLLLLSSFSFGQVGNITRASADSTKYGATTEFLKRDAWNRQEHQLGVIYNKNSWVSADISGGSNDFTQAGGITASIVSNKIQVSGGAGTFTQLLKLTGIGYTYLEHFKIAMKVKLGTITSTSYGFGIGTSSTNTFLNSSVLTRMGFVTGFIPTGVEIDGNYPGGTFSTLNFTRGSSVIPGSANDYILLTLEKNLYTFKIGARNITSNSAEIDTTYDYGENTGYFSIYSLGGTFTIDSLAITSTELTNASALFIGDSKVQGTAATSVNNRFVSLLGNTYKSVVDVGAGGDRTVEIINRLPQIISLKPKQAYIAIGSNDQRSGTAEGTIEANYLSIYNSLVAAGIDTYATLPMYETSEDQTALRTYIIGAFPAAKIIDLWYPMSIPGSLFTDGVHPNDLGHARIAAAFIQAGTIKEAKLVTSAVTTTTGTATPGGVDKNIQYNNANGLGGMSGVTTPDGTNTLSVTNLLLPGSGSGIATKIYNNGTSSVASTTFIYPASGTNENNTIYVVPKGTGVAGNKAELDLFGTDFIADPVNVQALSLKATGTQFNVSEQSGGTQPLLPLSLFVGSHTDQLKLNIDGSTAINGALSYAYRAITALRTLDATDRIIECTANSFTVTLPTAVGISGRTYVIYNTGAGTITLATTSSQTVNGTSPPTIATTAHLTITSNGANWLAF